MLRLGTGTDILKASKQQCQRVKEKALRVRPFLFVAIDFRATSGYKFFTQ
jgi:hypothetical protein